MAMGDCALKFLSPAGLYDDVGGYLLRFVPERPASSHLHLFGPTREANYVRKS